MRAFEVDQAALRAAIVVQHDEDLGAAGVVAADDAITEALPASGRPRGPYRSQGSMQTAFQRAVELAKRDGASLNSGYLLLAVSDAEHGTVDRALHHLGVDPALLRNRTRHLLAHRPSSPHRDR